MSTSTETIERLAQQEYKFGFVTDIEQELAPPGLNEDIIRLISEKKGDPEWLLEWRLKAYRYWEQLRQAVIAAASPMRQPVPLANTECTEPRPPRSVTEQSCFAW